jgi:hypothetical protein
MPHLSYKLYLWRCHRIALGEINENFVVTVLVDSVLPAMYNNRPYSVLAPLFQAECKVTFFTIKLQPVLHMFVLSFKQLLGRAALVTLAAL